MGFPKRLYHGNQTRGTDNFALSGSTTELYRLLIIQLKSKPLVYQVGGHGEREERGKTVKKAKLETPQNPNLPLDGLIF